MASQWTGWPWVAAGASGLAVVVTIGAAAGVASRDAAAASAPEPLTREVVTTVTETITSTATTVSTVTVTVTPPPPPGPAVEFTVGTYEVGVDVQPGKYKSPGPAGSMCYWARKSADGSNILDNGLSEGPVTITIKAGELIEISGCSVFKKA
ncbi:hypothetical protein UO65_0831 [Actinokineospora spheciospongiae]|uniref:Uncharacterized protein n=1 Tax=Actinokineospora spheciospongiae TaxID=909613 RepID=W7J4B9_9PSEU|nr:hypothetical protein [Actinokineospora spheciospongiae]EWC63857.1 hypothetical protein UO65_0831 [Actinokineospora spheciospongiae]